MAIQNGRKKKEDNGKKADRYVLKVNKDSDPEEQITFSSQSRSMSM